MNTQASKTEDKTSDNSPSVFNKYAKYALYFAISIPFIWIIGSVWESSSGEAFVGVPIGAVLQWTLALWVLIIAFSLIKTSIPYISKQVRHKFEGSESEDHHNDIYRFSIGITYLVAITSTFTTYIGVKLHSMDETTPFLETAAFTGFILIVPFLIVCYWKIMNVTATRKEFESNNWFKRIVAFVIIGGLGMSGILFLSTTTSVMGLGGKQVVKSDLLFGVSILEGNLIQVEKYRHSDFSLTQDLQVQKDKFSGYAERAKDGEFTNTVGKGALYKYLKGVSNTFKKVEGQVHSGNLSTLNEDIKSLYKQISELKEGIQQTGNGNILENKKLFFDNIKGINTKISLLSGASHLGAIKPSIENLDVNLILPALSNDNAKLASAQDQKIVSFQKAVHKSQEAILNKINNYLVLKPTLVEYETTAVLDGIFKYKKDIKIWWVAALFCDLFPFLIFLIFFIFGETVFHKKEKTRSEI